MASLTSNDTIESLQARVAELTALLTANDIAVPESKGASASAGESKTDSSAAGSAAGSTEGFMTIPDDAGDLEEAVEILNDEPGDWKGLILPAGEFVIPKAACGPGGWGAEAGMLTVPPGFTVRGAGDSTIIQGKFGFEPFDKYMCTGCTPGAPVTYENCWLETTGSNFEVRKWGDSELIFNNCTFSFKFICNGVPNEMFRIWGTDVKEGEKPVTVRFNNCKFVVNGRDKIQGFSKYCIHVDGPGGYAEMTDCVINEEDVAGNCALYVTGKGSVVDIRGAATDISKQKNGIWAESEGLININLPRRPKVVKDNRCEDVIKVKEGEVKYVK